MLLCELLCDGGAGVGARSNGAFVAGVVWRVAEAVAFLVEVVV